MTLTSKLAVVASASLVNPLDLGEAKAAMSQTYLAELASGTAVGQADLVFHDRRTLAASTSEDLDLAGVLLDPLGQVLTFARIKGIVVAAAAANTNDVIVGAAATTPWDRLLNATGTVTVRPGGVFAAFGGAADAVGYTVTPATGDLLKVANSGAVTSVTYDVIVIGASV